MVEKRRFVRHDAIHLLDYVVLDENGNQGTYSMGRTLDVSSSGMKLETTHAFTPGTTLLITVGLEDNLVDLTCSVTYCKAIREEQFISGISFAKMPEESKKILDMYIKAFSEQNK